jgi:hypothetical protein
VAQVRLALCLVALADRDRVLFTRMLGARQCSDSYVSQSSSEEAISVTSARPAASTRATVSRSGT